MRFGQWSGDKKKRGQRILGDYWLWKAGGQCSKGENSSFRQDTNNKKRAKSTQQNPSPRFSTQQSVHNASRTRSHWGRNPSGKLARLPCKQSPQRNLHNSILWKWHPPEYLFCKSEKGYSFGEKCSNAHRDVDEQPSKKSQKNGDKSATATLKITRQMGCVFQGMVPPKS